MGDCPVAGLFLVLLPVSRLVGMTGLKADANGVACNRTHGYAGFAVGTYLADQMTVHDLPSIGQNPDD